MTGSMNTPRAACGTSMTVAHWLEGVGLPMAEICTPLHEYYDAVNNTFF